MNDTTTPAAIDRGYRLVTEPWEPSFWERGNCRYFCLSYSLWFRQIRKARRVLRAERKAR